MPVLPSVVASEILKMCRIGVDDEGKHTREQFDAVADGVAKSDPGICRLTELYSYE